MTDQAIVPAPKRKRRYRKAGGAYALRRALRDKGLRGLDGRSTLARVAEDFIAQVEADLGGDLTATKRSLLQAAAAQHVLVAVIQQVVLSHPARALNGKGLSQLAKDLGSAATRLQTLLTAVGLERTPRPVQSLRDILQAPIDVKAEVAE